MTTERITVWQDTDSGNDPAWIVNHDTFHENGDIKNDDTLYTLTDRASAIESAVAEANERNLSAVIMDKHGQTEPLYLG